MISFIWVSQQWRHFFDDKVRLVVIRGIFASQVALVTKNPPANAGDTRDVGSIPVSGRSSGEGNGAPLQYSCLQNSTDKGAWWLHSMGSQRVVHNQVQGDIN